MTLLTVLSRSLRLVHLLALILVVGLAFGCASKAPGTRGGGETPSKSGKKRSKTPATQRPYVINGTTYYPIPSAIGYVEQGIASWYGEPFHGKKTSNGETYNMYGDTAAHKTLPMNTILLVKNLENGRSTIVRINDRGPFVQERIIDLTLTKAKELDIVGKGTARVEILAMETQPPGQEQLIATAPAKPPAETGKPPAGSDKPQPQPPPAKAPPIPDFDKGNFYVQVGAFVKIENARTLAKAFAKRGRDVVIQQYPAAGMNLYRVMIFASNSLAKAKVYEKELEAEGFRYALLLAR
ncbi:septal ring lytic transglycosylase RlpA family protein [Desulfobulbus sp.]|uniref:septal ring lytic transglycosylase RlpA family protein n=1 Tax=Desulfobulbus sp. TaxID=895 RepID=UPI00286F0B8A|nr:septal ring lytic transglycosylase RlpA family protein [Desulfobulbus sp.]